MAGEQRIAVLDLRGRLAGEGSGAIANLETEDLDVNLVRLPSGGGVGAHANREVDVFLIVVEGAGVVTAGGEEQALGPGQAVMIPKGLERAIRASDAGPFSYLTVHRRRARLWPSVRRA